MKITRTRRILCLLFLKSQTGKSRLMNFCIANYLKDHKRSSSCHSAIIIPGTFSVYLIIFENISLCRVLEYYFQLGNDYSLTVRLLCSYYAGKILYFDLKGNSTFIKIYKIILLKGLLMKPK